MSIIYDALKKVEKSTNKDAKPQVSNERKDLKSRIKVYATYVLVAGVGIFLANQIFIFLGKHPVGFALKPEKKTSAALPKRQAKAARKRESVTYQTLVKEVVPVSKKVLAAITPPAISKNLNKETQSPWVLSGVFFSQNEGYALINNQIVKEGDVISGVTVKRISLDEVELDSAGSIIKLSNRFK